MSGFISESSQTGEEQLATSRHGDSEQSPEEQYHTLSGTKSHSSMTMEENNEPEIEDAEIDISAGQKMLSAVSGSLLTSLLGSCLSSQTKKKSV